MKCFNKECDKEAIYQIAWAGEIKQGCDEHIGELNTLKNVLGG